MKKVLALFLLLSNLAVLAQDNFKLTITKVGTTNELILQETIEKRYSAIAKGNFAIIELGIEKITEDAPRRVMPDQISLRIDGKDYPCVGLIDTKSRLFDNRFGGISLYGQKKEVLFVFELPENIKVPELNFNGQIIALKITDEWHQNIPVPEMNVTKTYFENVLNQYGNKYGPEKAYAIEIQTKGSFAIVSIQVSFENDSEPRASDFFLINENGTAITAIGDIKNGGFRHNMNTGSLSLSAGQIGKISIVFPLGNQDINDIKSIYKLSYRGITQVNL